MMEAPAPVAPPTVSRSRPMIFHPRVVAGSGGGPDKTILNSPRFLRQMGYDSVCVYLRPPADPQFDALRRRARECEAALEEIDDRGPLDWRIVPAALELCRRHNVAVWHGHDYKTNLLGLLLRRYHPLRLVSTVHGWVHRTRRTPLYYRLDQWALRRYERVICVSPDLLDECRRRGVPDERCILIENAIDTEQFRRTRTAADAKLALGLSPAVPLLGAVGRLSAEKGFDLLIDAVAQLVAAGQPLLLAILGEGSERARLESRVAERKLQAHVRFAGFQPDARPWYEAMDLFVLSSRREGLPNVVLEAMAMETPVVAARVAGVPQLIEDGVNGRLVPIGDAAQLAVAIGGLLVDASARAAYAQASRRLVETRNSFHHRMEKVCQVYRSLGVEPVQPPVES